MADDDEPQIEEEVEELSVGGGGTARVPPYVAYSTFLTLLKELKDNGVPPQLDKSVLKRFAFGVQSQLKMGLRSLGMLDGDVPTPRLKAFVDAHETDRFPALLLEVLKEVYPYIFELDLSNATPSMFADAFKKSGAKGEDALRKCRSFFTHAAKQAGVVFGPRLANGSVPRSPTAPRRKPKPTKQKGEETPTPDSGQVTPPASDGKKLGKDHPLVTGLLMTLPTPGKRWDVDSRLSWLRMASSIFENIYEGKGRITIEVEAEKKTAVDQ